MTSKDKDAEDLYVELEDFKDQAELFSGNNISARFMPRDEIAVPHRCIKCGNNFKAKISLFNKRARCPKCKSTFCIRLWEF